MKDAIFFSLRVVRMRGRNRDDEAGPSGSGKRRKGVGGSGLQEANGSDSGRKKRGVFQQDNEQSSEQAPKRSKTFVRYTGDT